MISSKKVRVLIVDDSMLFRETVANGLSADLGIEVVGKATDPYDARDKILELEPDVLTLDVEMPKMSGIEFLKKLLPQYPIPVVVVSAVSGNVFDALDAGAVDFVTKPDASSKNSLDSFINELVIKIKIASTVKVGSQKKETSSEKIVSSKSIKDTNSIIAIGASTGGTEAIFEILKVLPDNMPGIVIAQHMPPVFTNLYAQRLNSFCAMEVREAVNGDIVKPGLALIAPGDYHMTVIKKSSGYFVECFKGEKVNGHCPSVDVLFDSVAQNAAASAIGVILTGMGFDGAKGLLKMKQRGAFTIGQNAQSCIVYGMPKVAYEIGAVTKQMELKSIAQALHKIVTGTV